MNSKYRKPLGISQAERNVIDTMIRSGKLVLRAEDLEKEFGYRRQIANLFLSRLCKKGGIQRLKEGIYRIVPLGSATANPVPDDSWAIAMELFSPCYISGWSAAEHWDLTEQIFNSTLVLTAQKTKSKNQEVAGLHFRTKHIPAKNIFGTNKIWSSNKQIQVADMHRTIIDILADPEIGGGGRHAMDVIKSYWCKKESSHEMLWRYAETLNDGTVFRRLGFTGEVIARLPEAWLEKCAAKIKKGIVKFDPSGPNTGPIATKWGLRMNLPSGDLS